MTFDWRKAWHTYIALVLSLWVVFNVCGVANDTKQPYLMSFLAAWMLASFMAPPTLGLIGLLHLYKWSKEPDENADESL